MQYPKELLRYSIRTEHLQPCSNVLLISPNTDWKETTTGLLNSFLCICKTPLAKGADVESRDEYNNAPLANVAKRGQTETVNVSSRSSVLDVISEFLRLPSLFVQLYKIFTVSIQNKVSVPPLIRLYLPGEHKLMHGFRTTIQP